MKNYQNKIKLWTLILMLSLATTIACQVKPTKSALNTKITQQLRTDDLVFSREGFIYFLPASKKEPQKIVKGDFPSFSRSQNQIAYVKSQPPEADAVAVVMIYDLKRKKSRELYRVKGFINTLQYDPEGDVFLFILRTPEGKTKLEIFNSSGVESFTINQSNKEIKDVFSPTWATDSNTIYFHDMTNLFHVSLDGQILKKTPLETITGSTETITSSDRFIPSPKDENVLVFTQLVPGTKLFENIFGELNTALFIYDIRRNKKTRMTPENMFAVQPVWSSNGESIIFTGYYDTNGRENYPFRIFSIKTEGSQILEITKGENADL